MVQERWFFRDNDEWKAFAERLKLMPCPHCKCVGALIRHGCLGGLADGKRTLRARRVFCSNRQARPGCGRTVSVWCADTIRRLSVTTHTLWRFLQQLVAGSIAAAIRSVAADCRRSVRTWQRLWKRFNLAQSTIRTALCGRCPPPELPAAVPVVPARRAAAAQVLAHLQAAFQGAANPIAAFQHAFRTFFV